MIKEEIKKDERFRNKACLYGLDWDNFETFTLEDGDYVIVSHLPESDIYVLFDKNYNTIDVDRCEFNDGKSLEKFATINYELAKNFPLGDEFGEFFKDFSLKNIIDLDNRIEVVQCNQGYPACTKVNGQWIEREDNKDYAQMLSYVKFLGKEIKQYFFYRYHMLKMGFDVPSVYKYIINLLSKVNEYIDYSVKNNERPLPYQVLNHIGQSYNIEEYNTILYDVLDLLLKEKGMKVKVGVDKIESIPEPDNMKIDFAPLATQLLEILNLTEEDIQKIEKEKREKMINDYMKSIKQCHQQDLDDPLLNRKKPYQEQ